MRRLAVLMVAVLVLSACGDDQPGLGATDVSSVRITGEQELGAAFAANLSPDGKALLSNSKRGTCVRGVDGSNEHCLRAGPRVPYRQRGMVARRRQARADRCVALTAGRGCHAVRMSK